MKNKDKLFIKPQYMLRETDKETDRQSEKRNFEIIAYDDNVR